MRAAFATLHRAPACMKQGLRRAFAFMIAIAAALATAELVCYLWLPVQSPRMYESIVPGDAVVGTMRNHQFAWRTAEFSVTVRLNGTGFREDFDFHLRDLDVAFMGDSFAFGHGVEVEERFTSVFARNYPQLRAASLSYPNGWQPEHYEYFMQRNPDLRPKLLVISLYLGNDLDSDVKETRVTRGRRGEVVQLAIPGRKVVDGYMVSNGVYPPAVSTLALHSYAVRAVLALLNLSPWWREYLIARSQPAYPPNLPNTLRTEEGTLDEFAHRALESLTRLRSLARERGAEMVVLVIPQNFHVGAARNPHIAREHSARAAEIARAGGLRARVLRSCDERTLHCLDAGSRLMVEDYFRLDPHWKPSGHRKVGEWLAAELRPFVHNQKPK
jgi:hypothetical protein